MSSSTAFSRPNQKIYRHIEARRNREITVEYPCLYRDGMVLERSEAGEAACATSRIAVSRESG